MTDGAAQRSRTLRRRPPLRLGVAVVTVVLVVLAAWRFVWLPHWRPPLQAGERFGIDVSAHQHLVDWRAVAADGITFAYIKASEGGDFTDVRFERNWREADAAGLDRGAYHFFTLCTPGAAQARHFLSVAPPEPAALPPALDIDLGGNCSDRPDPVDIAEEVDAFLRPVENEWGVPMVLYVGADFERRYPIKDRLDRPLWLFSLFGRPRHEQWWIWQLHGFASVAGVEGGVDLDVMRSAP